MTTSSQGSSRPGVLFGLVAAILVVLGGWFAVQSGSNAEATVVVRVLSGYLIGMGVAFAGVALAGGRPGRGWSTTITLAGGLVILVTAGCALAQAPELIAASSAGSPPSRQGFRFGLGLLVFGPLLGVAVCAGALSAMVRGRKRR